LAFALPVAIIAITIHEVSHGIVAAWLGDPTAKQSGRLTLNPVKHFDLMGVVMMVVIGFGWARPVPVNPMNFKKPKLGMAIVAAAGPLSNILLSFVFLCLLIALPSGPNTSRFIELVGNFLWYGVMMNIGFAAFNLIPISPLDGSKILALALPQRIYFRYMRFERYGMLVLMALIFLGLLDTPLSFLRSMIMNGELIIIQGAINLFYMIFPGS